jgi:lysophospholipase L1-like esterase/quercetin dioxygenase-like cupin family protein
MARSCRWTVAGWRAELRRAAGALLVAALAVASFAAHAAAPAAPRQVFIVGDSTASAYGPERAPRQGWGEFLGGWLDAGFVVHNHARNGRSSRSFIEQGWLEPVERGLRRGDFLLIQFGHNDAKHEDPARFNAAAAFPRWLMRYVALARERGATPVLITPLARRKFAGTEPVDTHGAYARVVRELAAREAVALVDLDAASRDWLRALGPEASKLYYMHVSAQAQADDTHLQFHGAAAVACLVAAGWQRVEPALQGRLRRDTDCGARPTALADRAAQAAPSQVVQQDTLATPQPGPHGGAGATTAFPFFADAGELPFFFRRRVLGPGAGIGLHQHDKDEVYYVISGRGRYVLDGQVHAVGPGHAMLTRTGSTHAIQQDGDADLVLLIAYARPSAPPR